MRAGRESGAQRGRAQVGRRTDARWEREWRAAKQGIGEAGRARGGKTQGGVRGGRRAIASPTAEGARV
eukprot:4534515-Prymnesium_polylepis.1